MNYENTIEFISSIILNDRSCEIAAIEELFKESSARGDMPVRSFEDGLEIALSKYGSANFDYVALVDHVDANRDTILKRLAELSDKCGIDMTTYTLTECMVEFFLGAENDLTEFSRKHMVIVYKMYDPAVSAKKIERRMNRLVESGYITSYNWMFPLEACDPLNNTFVVSTDELEIHMDGVDIHYIVFLCDLVVYLLDN